MRRTIVIYALCLAALVFLLKMLEYRFMVRDLTLEFYLGVVAVLFTALGVWAGWKLTQKRATEETSPAFAPPAHALKEAGISAREYEVLVLMASGCSNQEIADKLFVSLNTIKTHTANLFVKLDARRRTQAIQKAKTLGLLP